MDSPRARRLLEIAEQAEFEALAARLASPTEVHLSRDGKHTLCGLDVDEVRDYVHGDLLWEAVSPRYGCPGCRLAAPVRDRESRQRAVEERALEDLREEREQREA